MEKGSASNCCTSGDHSLTDIRKRIDSIDAQLMGLLNQRAKCSIEVGRIKAGSSAPVFRPAREKALLESLAAANPGPLPDDHLTAIYREILSSSKALQQPLRIAFLGPEGTFSHMAGLEQFGSAMTFVPMGCLADIFSAVEKGACNLGIVPLENSLYGTVSQSVDLFATSHVQIQAEWYSRISHALMAQGGGLEDIKSVYSHAQPLGQCAEWLRRNVPNAQQASVESTAAAAHIASHEKGAAAIGHKGLAERLGLSILAEGIEDFSDNWTRFFAIGKKALDLPEANKTSILFTLPDTPGSLAAILQVLAEAGVNLNKLESRPIPSERWKYIFFADLTTNINTPEHAKLRENLRSRCLTYRTLGMYLAGKQHMPA